MYDYWKQQTTEAPLYPDIEWSKPEQRGLAGKLGIIGGNKLGFSGIAESYSVSLKAGVGEVRVLLPDALKKSIPPVITDAIFGETTPSGSLARGALTEMQAITSWSQAILLAGDAGRNSETAIVYEDFVRDYIGQLTITRDAFDLLKNSAQLLAERSDTLLVLSFAQLQKLFQSVYYPKMLTFSMQLAQVVEAVHKFTITYPVTIIVFHKDYLIASHDGKVTTTSWQNPMSMWRGTVASYAASYWLWNKNTPLEAVTASFYIQTKHV